MSQWAVCSPALRFFVPCDRKPQRVYSVYKPYTNHKYWLLLWSTITRNMTKATAHKPTDEDPPALPLLVLESSRGTSISASTVVKVSLDSSSYNVSYMFSSMKIWTGRSQLSVQESCSERGTYFLPNTTRCHQILFNGEGGRGWWDFKFHPWTLVCEFL